MDRAGGLAEIAVYFSAAEPLSFCRRLTISSLLREQGRRKRDDVTGYMLTECATIRIAE
jgi:hypothetical protein